MLPTSKIVVTITSAEAQLQPLMDVTVRRLSEYLEEETNDVTEEEITHAKSTITSLVPTEVDLGGQKLLIKHKFVMTTVDGKVCNAATGKQSRSRGRKSKEEKGLEDQTKREIQTRFRTETGLLIDMPKSNFGNTNDENTSRRFFENPK
ncbi:unnamed protein product [Psylliodes chrysocephalus]|uniref:Uncharacterized protein n=1 Tax=Psylliodes chrysocephalus TaxID=3402493 RepID=A0A9P0C870_9CUCU|nr:unnamed protein product [Psylliodes chrysocephala]